MRLLCASAMVNHRESVSIPVIANGDISRYDDIASCLEATGAEGVMCACISSFLDGTWGFHLMLLDSHQLFLFRWITKEPGLILKGV